MKKEDKQKELKRILPLLWNSYQHMYDVRVNHFQNKANFLLVIISFLPILSFMLFEHFENNVIFLVPILFQILAFFILLKSFFFKRWPLVHWFPIRFNPKSNILEDISKREFDKKLFGDLKALEDVTNVYQDEMNKVIHPSIYFILFSLCWIISATLLIYFKVTINLSFLTFILTCGLFSLIISLYNIQPDLLRIFNIKSEEHLIDIENWLNKLNGPVENRTRVS